MYTIPVILGSTREGRTSARVATFLEHKLRATGRVSPEILWLTEAIADRRAKDAAGAPR